LSSLSKASSSSSPHRHLPDLGVWAQAVYPLEKLLPEIYHHLMLWLGWGVVYYFHWLCRFFWGLMVAN